MKRKTFRITEINREFFETTNSTAMTTEKNPSDKHNEDYEIDTLTNDRLMKDHEYDGIRELDNGPPSWFNWLFILTIAFAVIYLVRLWVFRADDLVQMKEFNQEMAEAQRRAPAPVDAGVFEVKILTDEQSLANGKQTFNNICAVCHLVDGGGLVGPNLTDNYWIHGNTIEDLFRITTEGVIEKGMIPYRDQLSPTQRLEVSSYILEELVGSTPAKAKDPQGELYE
jgi:cytochrome c oxidase cbb3-type subunit III